MLKKLFKVLSLVLVLAACISFASCDSSNSSNMGSNGDITQNPGYNQTPNGTLDIRIESEQLITNTKYELQITSPDIYLPGGIEGMVFSLTNNEAEAIIENGFITAKKVGKVTLKVNFTDERGNLAVGQKEFVFTAPSITLKEYTNTLYVGDNVELGYKLDRNYENFQGVTYEVVKGDAKIFANDKGVQYIRASKAGEVTVAITYKAKDVEIKGEGTIVFSDHNFVITSPNAAEYVGYSVVMNATCETMRGFKAENVVYSVTDENGVVEGNVIKYLKEGVLTVNAEYIYNEEVIRTSVDITFTYDENTIFTAEDLSKLRNSDKVFNLLADIDLSTYGEWAPINGFKGTLYGNGHSITGININAKALGEPAGLFGTLEGTVENLKINGTLTCYGEIGKFGLLCGYNKGTVKDVTAFGTVNAMYSDYVGGVVGYSENGNMINCKSSVNVSGRDYVGGVVGLIQLNKVSDRIVDNFANSGTVTGRSYVGGIAGKMQMNSGERGAITMIVSNFVNSGTVNATADCIGGIFGEICGNQNRENAFYKLAECTNSAEISGANKIGGIVGSAPQYVSEIILCKNTGNISGQMYVGGFVGDAPNTALKNLENNVKVTGKAYVGGIAGIAGDISSCKNNGTVTTVGYHIDDNNTPLSYVGGIAGHVNNIVDCVNNSSIDVSNGGYYVGGIVGYLSATRSSTSVIQNNVNNGEIKGTDYVGGIAGIMIVKDEKNNEVITVNNNTNNGVINGTGNCVGGIFGQLSGRYSYISYSRYYSNVKVVSCTNEATVSGNDYVGGIVGYSPEYVSEISLCKNNDSITGNLYVGGIVGYASGTTLRNMTNTQTITGKAYLGGIAGLCGKVDGCTNNGDIINVDYYVDNDLNALSYIGGIAGYATGVANCTNEKSIDISDGGYYVGGVVGYLAKTRDASDKVEGNKNHGEIKGTYYVGGIAGAMVLQSNSNNDIVIVSSNTNDGVINGTNDYVGGIFGYVKGDYSYISYSRYYSYVKITTCNNEAAVSGNDYVGGIIGYAPEYVSEISLCTNVDDVTGNLYVGGYAGYASGTSMTGLKNSYTITGKAYIGGIAGYAGAMSKCENNGKVIATGYIIDNNDSSALSYVGGIAGYATGASDCKNNANIDASNLGKYVGGIVGYIVNQRSASVTFSNNQNHGEIKGTSYVGGIAGYFTVQGSENNDTITVQNNINDGAVIASSDYVGGIFGYLSGNHIYSSYNHYYANVKMTSCKNDADVTGNNYVGGLVGSCGEYVEKAETAWNTNVFTGSITANGEYQGEKYGHMA